MNDKISSISVIWRTPDRKPIEECAKMAYDFLWLLKNYDACLFGTWYEKGNSKKKALENEVVLSAEYLYNALEKNWDKKFPESGSRISYWTGHEEGQSGAISFNLGAFGNKSFNKNTCVLNLPYEGDFCTNKAKGLIALMSNYWKPDRVLVNGEEAEDTYSHHPQ